MVEIVKNQEDHIDIGESTTLYIEVRLLSSLCNQVCGVAERLQNDDVFRLVSAIDQEDYEKILKASKFLNRLAMFDLHSSEETKCETTS